MAGLSPQQRKFCEELASGCKGAEAARRAGYSAKSARQTAADLRTNPDIRAYLQELQQGASERAQFSVADLIGMLVSIAREGGRDRVPALKLIGDHLGAWTPAPPDDDGARGAGGGMTIVPADSANWKDEATHGRA